VPLTEYKIEKSLEDRVLTKYTARGPSKLLTYYGSRLTEEEHRFSVSRVLAKNCQGLRVELRGPLAGKCSALRLEVWPQKHSHLDGKWSNNRARLSWMWR